MATRADVAVVGLGAMGSAVAFHAASRGLKVIGLDRHHPPHAHGSSHGRTRIIREAYHEHPAYVPLVRRAAALWSALEATAGRSLFVRTGGLLLGVEGGELVAGALESARAHGLAHDRLGPDEATRRFPGFRPGPGMTAVFEPNAGVLFPEACVQAHLDAARARGADLRPGVAMETWSPGPAGITVATAQGVLHARRLVLAAGAWMPALLAKHGRRLTVERQVQMFVTPRAHPERFGAPACPVFIVEHERGRFFYGIPDTGDGVKVALHHEGAAASPESVERAIDPNEEERLRVLVRRFMPGLDGARREASVCLYTNAPDGHFVVGPHPDDDRVVVCSPCSGHGFKFASVIGEVVADLLETGRSRHDISLFDPRRLT